MSFTTNHATTNSAKSDRLVAILQAVARGERSAADVAQFSDLRRPVVSRMATVWPELPVDARRYLTRQMVELAEHNVALRFDRMLRVAMADDEPDIRTVAIRGLWEDDSISLLDQLLDAASTEPDAIVREAIAVALGRFSYLSVTDGIDEERTQRVRDVLLGMLESGEPVSVRRRALESVAYFSDDFEVQELIGDAYQSPIHEMQVSAVFAMGRNLEQRWFEIVLAELESDDPELRYEAAKASGEFGDQRAIDPLLELVDDEDREVQLTAINALGQIGGRVAKNALQRMVRSHDDVVKEAAEEALWQANYDTSPSGLI